MSDIILGPNDSGKQFVITLTDRLIINLEQLGGAGYDWQKDDCDPDYFQEKSPQDTAVKGHALGGSGVKTFILQPLKKGTTHIKLTHCRPWEPADSVINEFSLKVVIM